MKFDTFVINLGYLQMIGLVIGVIMMIIVFMFIKSTQPKKEPFSIARASLIEGLPGPVWWYFPMHQVSP